MKKIFYLKTIVIMFAFAACKEDSEKRIIEIEKTELAKGVRYDSLFLGIHLGMSSKAFYAVCWELNKNGILSAGSANLSVSLQTNELKYPATINFYPTFVNDKIGEMPMLFQYDSWAPWVRHAQPDKLQIDVLELMEKRYGGGFIKIMDKQKGLSFVKIEGNRKIEIYQKPEMYVRVVFSDLTLIKKG